MLEGPTQKTPSPNKNNFFESPNVHKEHFLIEGAQVDAIDVMPENQKDEVPVLVAPGWGATMKSFEPGIGVLAEAKRRVLSLDHPRKGGKDDADLREDMSKWCKKEGQDSPGWSLEELRKAETILGLLDQKKVEKVDVIAHSEGAINVCIAAMLQPEKFIGRTIVLVNPAGMIGKDNIFRLQGGAGANKSRTETVSHIPVTEAETEYLKSTKNITPEYINAGKIRTVKELYAISQARIEEMLRYLHKKGIRIIVMAGVEDTMFPMAGMQKNIKKDFIDGLVSVKGGHMQIQVHPELYMGAAESLLEKTKERVE
ncbi:MAG: alpha/beta hydrolase [Candidatus Paceibacterota bacterium]|jgi:pimeloyl-ACP methyl ester carboxylesterase